MLAEPPRSSEPRSYDLCVRSDSFRLKHAEVAVTVSDEGIAYELDGRRGLRAFGELESVRILAQSGGENSPWESIMELKFRSGRPLNIHSTSPWGVDDPARDVAYIAFAEDLHRRIPETERGRIRFLRGASDGRYRFMVGVFVFFLLLFGGAGLFVLSAGLSERTSWLKVLGVLTGIVVFGYAFVQVLGKARPEPTIRPGCRETSSRSDTRAAIGTDHLHPGRRRADHEDAGVSGCVSGGGSSP